MPGTAPRQQLDAIQPDSLYPIAAFMRRSGITHQRRREADAAGVRLPTIDVGRRKYVEGFSGISYIKQLAELTARAKAQQ